MRNGCSLRGTASDFPDREISLDRVVAESHREEAKSRPGKTEAPAATARFFSNSRRVTYLSFFILTTSYGFAVFCP